MSYEKTESEEKGKKKWETKPTTPLEALRGLPKAMQVGPQPQLRKSFYVEVKDEQA